jgi:hypothetical protein
MLYSARDCSTHLNVTVKGIFHESGVIVKLHVGVSRDKQLPAHQSLLSLLLSSQTSDH